LPAARLYIGNVQACYALLPLLPLWDLPSRQRELGHRAGDGRRPNDALARQQEKEIPEWLRAS
jgi:hypothetical protein